MRALAYIRMKEYDKAIMDFTTAIKLNPSDLECTRRAEAYIGLKEYDKAFADYK